MDWDQLRFFVALAEEGSHSAAARRLKVTQPTVGRRIRLLEAELRVHLFERSAERYLPSAAGRALLERALAIRADVEEAERALRAYQDQAAGVVRISAPDWVVSRVLSPMVPSLVEAHPSVCVELAAETALTSIPAGAADIALRARRFDLPGTWQRVVGRVEFGLYASRKYVRRRGHQLESAADGHRVVGMDDRDGPIADVEWLKRVAKGVPIVARANGREALAQLVRGGCGIGCLPVLLGDADPQLVRLEGLGAAPERRLWLGVHREQRELPRIRRVRSAIVEALAVALPLR